VGVPRSTVAPSRVSSRLQTYPKGSLVWTLGRIPPQARFRVDLTKSASAFCSLQTASGKPLAVLDGQAALKKKGGDARKLWRISLQFLGSNVVGGLWTVKRVEMRR
jgi:hypothetical protein